MKGKTMEESWYLESIKPDHMIRSEALAVWDKFQSTEVNSEEVPIEGFSFVTWFNPNRIVAITADEMDVEGTKVEIRDGYDKDVDPETATRAFLFHLDNGERVTAHCTESFIRKLIKGQESKRG